MTAHLGGHAIFDLDGTLIDSAPLCASLLNGMLEDRGAPIRLTEDQTRPFVTRGGPAMVRGLLGAHCGDAETALAEFRARYAEARTPAESLYPDVSEGLAALAARGVGLALYSNKPRHLCEKVLVDLGLRNLFSAVVGAGPGVPLKPDPAGFYQALELSGGALERCCYVGDSEVDHEVAQRVGVPYVMVTHGYGDYARVWPGAILAPDFRTAASRVVEILKSLVSVAHEPSAA